MQHVFHHAANCLSSTWQSTLRQSWSWGRRRCRVLWYRYRSSLSVHGIPQLLEPLHAIGRGRLTFTGRVLLGCPYEANAPTLKTVIRAEDEKAYIGIGHNTQIGNGLVVCAEKTWVLIGSDVRIAHGVHITDHMHSTVRPLPYKRHPLASPCMPVVLEDDVVIGAYVRICGGVTIGRGASVESYALVTADVPERAFFRATPPQGSRAGSSTTH